MGNFKSYKFEGFFALKQTSISLFVTADPLLTSFPHFNYTDLKSWLEYNNDTLI